MGKLDSLQRVRLELTKIYKEARTGTLETQEATRLCFLLVNIAKLIESSDLEQRLEQVEAKLGVSKRRITTIEQYARANLVPVSQVVELLDAMVALFRTWTDEPYAPEMVALVEFYAAPLRSGDVAEVQRRHAEWQKLDDEQRLHLLRKDGGHELTNANQET